MRAAPRSVPNRLSTEEPTPEKRRNALASRHHHHRTQPPHPRQRLVLQHIYAEQRQMKEKTADVTPEAHPAVPARTQEALAVVRTADLCADSSLSQGGNGGSNPLKSTKGHAGQVGFPAILEVWEMPCDGALMEPATAFSITGWPTSACIPVMPNVALLALRRRGRLRGAVRAQPVPTSSKPVEPRMCP